ncbi:MAG: DUF1538 domain-containing protein [Pseudolabrys sp.]|nr:DUF1538 domain-containing protein [Pseudolabrys sp.]MDP2297057.1 DUF1538 domain-containing protein [Pseudolabrys sp.]
MFDLLVSAAAHTMRDVVPVALVIGAFQAFVLRQRPAHFRRILVGTVFLVLGLILFRFGITESLLPIGSLMAAQLSGPDFVGNNPAWFSYGWLYAFALAVGLSATLIEPTLIAIAERARDLSGGVLRPWGFRLAVAIGVALGMLIGTLRIVLGLPLSYVFAGLVMTVTLVAIVAPKPLRPLAFDSGGVATSVVIVPLITAFSLNVAKSVPGRDPLVDGFGLVMLVFLMPIVTVLIFARLTTLRARQRH